MVLMAVSVQCEVRNAYVVILARKFSFIYTLVIFATVFKVFEICTYFYITCNGLWEHLNSITKVN